MCDQSIPAPITKQCGTCKQIKLLDDFHRDSRLPDGHTRDCKECAKQRARAWTAANREYARQQSRLAYEANKDRYKENARKWAAANLERRKEIRQKSAHKHKAKKASYARMRMERMKRENPELVKEIGRRNAAIRRSRELSNGPRIEQQWWNALVAINEEGVCLYCGRKSERLTLDHFVPVVKGGPTLPGNLLPCCKSCNSSKNDNDPEEWVVRTYGRAHYEQLVLFLRATQEAWEEWERDKEASA